MKDLISIIVPIYNAERYLEKCLLQLQVQTYSNIEILMIDDGSTDQSASICKRYLEVDKRFQYIYQDNAGVSAARNKGLSLAKGNYIGFCDSDDWVDADLYEVLYQMAVQHSADISIVSFVMESESGTKPFEDQQELLFFNSRSAIEEMHRCGRFEGYLWNKLFSASLFTDVRLRSDITILEDMVAVWELFHKADRIVFRDVHKYHYFRNQSSATKCEFKQSYWTVRIACRQMIDNMKQFYPDLLAYAQKTSVEHNYFIAHKIYQSYGTISKIDYDKIKEEIRQNYTAEVIALLDSKNNFKLRCFLLNRWLFCLVEFALCRKNCLKRRKGIG